MTGLPQGWAAATLDEICEFNPKHDSNADRSQLVSFVPMPAVSEHSGAIEGASDRPLSEIWKGYTHFADGDVIFAKITPCMENGKAAVARDLTNGIACGSTEFHVLRSRGAALPDYVWRFMRQDSFRRDAEAHMAGAVGQRRVPKPYLERHAIPLPPLAEQRRITRKLDTLTARITAARTHLNTIEKLVERYKEGVLTQELSGSLLGHEPDDRNIAPITNDKERGSWGFTTLPSHWVWQSFKQFLTNRTDSKRKLPRRDYDADGLYPVIDQGADLIGGYSSDGTLVLLVDPPFIIFGDHTRCVKFFEAPFIQGADGVKVFHAGDGIAIKFAYWALRALRLPDKGYSRHTKFLRESFFPCPPLEEQYEIVRRIEIAFACIDRLRTEAEAALKLTDRLDQSILARAFSGELVPQNPDDEPAEALLTRIREART